MMFCPKTVTLRFCWDWATELLSHLREQSLQKYHIWTKTCFTFVFLWKLDGDRQRSELLPLIGFCSALWRTAISMPGSVHKQLLTFCRLLCLLGFFPWVHSVSSVSAFSVFLPCLPTERGSFRPTWSNWKETSWWRCGVVLPTDDSADSRS